MENVKRSGAYPMALSVVLWGAMWGIFEATVSYLLHLLPISIGWLVWVPVACFFMANVYRKTKSTLAVVLVGLLCASIKLLNLLMPIRVDKVINPAVSILFEALAMAAVLLVLKRAHGGKNKNLLVKAASALAMNTGWRLLYVLYLLFLVPGWIRDVSVLSSAEKFIPFFITQNLLTSLILFIGYLLKDIVFKPAQSAERKIASAPSKRTLAIKACAVALLLCADIALELLL